MPRSKSLNLRYVRDITDHTAFFEDGTSYTPQEQLIAAHASPDDLRAIHEVKKAFDGLLLSFSPV